MQRLATSEAITPGSVRSQLRPSVRTRRRRHWKMHWPCSTRPTRRSSSSSTPRADSRPGLEPPLRPRLRTDPPELRSTADERHRTPNCLRGPTSGRYLMKQPGRNRDRSSRPAPTADVTIEAWAPSRSGCLEELVRGVVETFADTRNVTATREVPLEVGAAPETMRSRSSKTSATCSTPTGSKRRTTATSSGRAVFFAVVAVPRRSPGQARAVSRGGRWVCERWGGRGAVGVRRRWGRRRWVWLGCAVGRGVGCCRGGGALGGAAVPGGGAILGGCRREES